VIACMVFARSAAMAFNRYLDRYFDALNPRTAQREIPVGVIKPRQALAFTVGMSVLFVSCAWLINTLCFFLSPLALLIILGYSYTKRFTPLCHLVLGAGLSLAPIGAYLAVTGQFAMVPLFFSFAVLTWVSGFDIIYSLQDETFDRSQDLYSIPVWLGTKKALGVSRVLHSASFILIGLAGWYGPFGWIYWGGALLYGGLLIYQQWLVSPDDLSRVNLAFMTVNGIASILFSVFVIADLYIQ
jgi:4-hydroxybenzoate polyprenyltransferase